MNINKINTLVPVYTQKNDNNNRQSIAFKGARTNALKYALNLKKDCDTALFRNRIAAVFNMKNSEITPLTKGFKKHKMKLLYRLTDKYNADIYNNTELNPQKAKTIVFNIYNKVKYPNNTHINLIDDTNYSLEQLDKIFDITEKEPKKLSLVDNLLSVYPYKTSFVQLPFETMEEFLTTKSSKKIAENFENYKPYISLNAGDKNIVKNLEQEIEKGYNKNLYVKKLNIAELYRTQGVLNDINPDLIEVNYKPEGVELLKSLNKVYSTDYSFKTKNYRNQFDMAATIMNIYNSTTAQNLKARSKVFEFVQSHVDINKKFEKAPLDTVERIFQKIDADQEAKKLIHTTVGKESDFASIEQIDNVLTNADLKKLNSRPDLVRYALLNRKNLVEFSKEDFQNVDKHIELSKQREKRELEKSFYSPNPFIMDLHNLKVKIKNFFERF